MTHTETRNEITVTVSETDGSYFFYASKSGFFAAGQIKAKTFFEAINEAFREGARQILIKEGDDILRNAG